PYVPFSIHRCASGDLGKPRVLRNFPRRGVCNMVPLSEQQRSLQLRARELAQSRFAATAADTDRTEQYPWANVELLRDAGFMGMTLPRSVGGQGRSYHDAVIVIEEMAKACATMGRITVEANMGAIGAIARYGTEEQLRLAAAAVLSGDKPAICI